MDRFPWVWPLSLGTGARPTRLAACCVVETPELWRLDDEHVGGHLADAWNARQDVEPLAQVRVGVAQRFEALIDRFDLAVDLAEPLSELTLDEGRDGDGLAVEGSDAVLDEGVTGVDEFPHGLDRRADGGLGSSSRTAPMRASMRASHRSVLASLPVAWAKRLA